MLKLCVTENKNRTWRAEGSGPDGRTFGRTHYSRQDAVHFCLDTARAWGYGGVLSGDVTVTTLAEQLVRQKVEEVVGRIQSNREQFVAAYLAKTGADPRDLTLCEQTDGLTQKFWVQRRDDVMLSFDRFSEVNRDRCESAAGFNHTLDSWSLSDWMTAIAGEVGEAANVVKKLNRIRDGVPGNDPNADDHALRADLRKEVADVFIYLDLFAQRLGFRLRDAVAEKFDETSRKIGYPVRIKT